MVKVIGESIMIQLPSSESLRYRIISDFHCRFTNLVRYSEFWGVNEGMKGCT
jgi:hypothetical protein